MPTAFALPAAAAAASTVTVCETLSLSSTLCRVAASVPLAAWPSLASTVGMRARWAAPMSNRPAPASVRVFAPLPPVRWS